MTSIEIIGVAHGEPLAAISDIKTVNQGKLDEHDIVNYYFEHRKFKVGKAYRITIKEITNDC